jgi:hypothetical protein
VLERLGKQSWAVRYDLTTGKIWKGTLRKKPTRYYSACPGRGMRDAGDVKRRREIAFDEKLTLGDKIAEHIRA